MKMEGVPSIAEWLAGKNLLVTGSTGYIGKVLIEKILRCCPEVNKIYLLLRPKRGKTVDERFQDVLKSELWTLSKFNYDFSKLVPIEANLSVAGMGLSQENIKILHENVHIVYHSAASIKFVDPFNEAVKSNVRLTRDMIELAKEMKKLEIFVQISTAYVNVNHLDIEEKVYPPHMDWRKAIELAETGNPLELNAVTAKMLDDFPNTYTFTKNLAEHVVWDHRHQLPILIYRPVVVNSLLREPAAGWSDNVSGPEVTYYAVGKGLIRVMHLRDSCRMNWCPGDITINGLLASTWKLACHSKVTGAPAANVVCSSHESPNISVMWTQGEKALDEQPIPDTIWREYHFHIANPTLFWAMHLMFNVFPALVIQTAAKLAGYNLPMLTYLKRYYTLIAILMPYFTFNYFKMHYDNQTEATDALNEKDKKTFSTVILREGETYVDLVKNCVARFSVMLKDRDLPLKERLRQRRLRFMIDNICRMVLIVLVLYYIPYQSVLKYLNAFIQQISIIFLGSNEA